MSIFALADAIAMLTHALRLLKELRPCTSRSEAGAAPAHRARRSDGGWEGYGATEVLSVYERAVNLSRRLGQKVGPPVLRGLAIAAVNCCRFTGHVVRPGAAGAGHRGPDDRRGSALRARRHSVLDRAVPRFPRSSRRCAGQVPARPRFGHLARFAQDPQAVCLARLGLTLWYLGRPDEASSGGEGPCARRTPWNTP